MDLERQHRINESYKLVANSSVHKKYSFILKEFKGWTGQKIAATLKKTIAYQIDNPQASFSKVYADAFGLTIK